MMRTVSLLLPLLLCTSIAYTQGKNNPATTNKQKLAQLDSLVKEFEKKKNELADQLTEFMHHAKEVKQEEPVEKPSRQTINERISYLETEIRSKKISGINNSSSLARLENTIKKIRKTNTDMEIIKKRWANTKGSLSEMNEMDMLMLQQIMEKKNQLESMISNAMKAGYEGGQAAIQALKAS